MTAHHRLGWFVFVLLIWGLAFVRVFIDPVPRVPLLFNITGSVPYKVAVMQYRTTSFRRGDWVIFAFSGDAQKQYPGLAGQPFFKVIRGLPGDRITVRERHVYVNGEDMGTAKQQTFDHKPLEPIAEMVIPPAHYYVQGTSPDSFDSRYQSSGLVNADHIIGKVTPLF